ncbi:MAG TPA: hypothetical protein VKJ65_12255 [Phycisphaerae bacterium]|nr:hypothetical protein [Phycisphaerae bacterium]
MPGLVVTTSEPCVSASGPRNKRENGNAALSQSIKENDPINKVALCIFLFIVPAFIFDHSVSDIMYAFGYDQNKISNVWFLRDQFEILKESRSVVGLNRDPFRVFELCVWFSIGINIARLSFGIFFLGNADDARSKWKQRNVSGFKYFCGWIVCGPGALVVSALGTKYTSSTFAVQDLLAYSPKTLICTEALVFSIGSFFTADGILTFLQLIFGGPRVSDTDATKHL